MAFAEPVTLESRGLRLWPFFLGNGMRRDATIRNTVVYSLRAGEWPELKAQLLYQLDKPIT